MNKFRRRRCSEALSHSRLSSWRYK